LASHTATPLRHHFENEEQQKEASSLGMWVFLLTEIMFFGGMFMAYLAYRQLYPESFAAASSKLNVTLGAMNTLVLICSSLTMAMGVHSAALGKQKLLVIFLILTLCLGCVFLGIKAIEYTDKFVHHEVPGINFHPEDWPKQVDMSHASLYFALYFGLTGLHASHMVVGVCILLFLIYKANKRAYTAEWHTPVEMFGLYWHFVDIVWIFLFPLLYLIDPHFGK
jgi:cytochrome c oxidase subunit III